MHFNFFKWLKNIHIYIYIYGIVIPLPIITISCSNKSIDDQLKNEFNKWYNELSKNNWNKDLNDNFINYYCESEQQAIGLYSWCSGTFWNEYLHSKLEPKNHYIKFSNSFLDNEKALEVRGLDYKFIDSALEKATYPRNDTLWHGLEYMEIEFWDQLKNYITIKTDGSFNYEKCIGKSITSFGFISSTLNKKYAINFFDWKPQYHWPSPNLGKQPLKEKVTFKINIKKGYKGAAYLANFDFAGFGTTSKENQVLIKRNSKFIIKNIWKDNDINFFEVDLLE